MNVKISFNFQMIQQATDVVTESNLTSVQTESVPVVSEAQKTSTINQIASISSGRKNRIHFKFYFTLNDSKFIKPPGMFK